MTVTTTLDRQNFDGDGSNKNFSFNFKFFNNSQIFVFLISADGTAVGQTQNVDYTISGANSAGGGQIVFTVAPPVGDENVLVSRVLPLTQPTSIRNQGAFFPAIHEDAFDRLTMLIQQAAGAATRSLQKDLSGRYWDFMNYQAINLADPTRPQDAANMRWVQQYIGALIGTGQGPVNSAANVLYTTPAGVVGNLQGLSSSDKDKGVSYVFGAARVVQSISELMTLPKTASKQAFVTSYYGDGLGGGGEYRQAYLTAPGGWHDGGAQITANDGAGWELCRVLGVVTAKQYGCKGDRSANATARFQALLDYVEAKRGEAFIEDGNYQNLGTILIPNFITIRGQSIGGTVVGSQLDARAVPNFANKDTGTFQYVTMSSLSIRGGTWGLFATVSAETAHNNFTEVAFALHTAGGYGCSKFFQTSTFTKCIFDTCFQGVFCGGGTANLNNFNQCDWVGIAGFAVRFLVASEVNNFFGCRFETGAVNGNITINIVDGRDNNFIGCYFERTHNNLLVETGNTGQIGVRFIGCHFTGALNSVDGTIIPYVFTSDGLVEFGSNSWFQPSDGPERMLITGYNGGKLGNNNTVQTSATKKYNALTTKSTVMGSGTNQYRLCSFTRTGPTASNNESQLIMGRAMVTVQFANASGLLSSYAADVPFAVVGIAAAALSITVGTPVVAINTAGSGTLTVTLAVEPGPTATQCFLRATVSGAAAPVSGFIQATIETSSGSNPGFQQIAVGP